jgi:hypothetical protein
VYYYYYCYYFLFDSFAYNEREWVAKNGPETRRRKIAKLLCMYTYMYNNEHMVWGLMYAAIFLRPLYSLIPRLDIAILYI